MPVDIQIPTSRSDEWEVLTALDGLDDGLHSQATVVRQRRDRLRTPRDRHGSRRVREPPVHRSAVGTRRLPIHGLTHGGTAGIPALRAPGAASISLGRYPDWDTYIDSRIALWLEAEPQGLAPDPFLRLVASWLDANRPEPVPLGLVHGDFHPANVIVTSDDEYMAVDWELAHVGDPREDLGWMALAAEVQPPDLVGSDADSFYATYCKAANLPVEAIDEKTLMYFVVLGSTDCYLASLERLAGSRPESRAPSDRPTWPRSHPGWRASSSTR